MAEISGFRVTGLYELKGTYFLRTGDYKEAMKWYDRVSQSYCTIDSIYDYENNAYAAVLQDQFNGYSGISPLIFSNGFKRLFSVPATSQLTDQGNIDKFIVEIAKRK